MKQKRQEIILLLLPVIALLLLALAIPRLQAKPEQTLTLNSVSVRSLPRSQRNAPDVQVEARFNDNQSFQERQFLRNANVRISNARIVDSAGKTYYRITWAPQATRNIVPSSLGVGPGPCFAEYELWLRYFPKIIGKLTFKFTVIAQDGYALPVSIVVRP